MLFQKIYMLPTFRPGRARVKVKGQQKNCEIVSVYQLLVSERKYEKLIHFFHKE